jgi:hypothetical protein
MHNVLYETYRTGRLSRTVHAAVLEDAELHPTYHANDNRAIDKSLTQDSLWRVTSTKALENGVDLLPGPSQRVEIYDSGATHHVSPYIDAFTDLKFIPPKPISAANNQTFDAIGEGNIQVEIPNGENFTLVTLCNVLYAPNVAFTLISLSQADKAGYSTLIEDGVLYLIDRSSNTVVGKIPVQGGLWSVKLTKALENGNNLLPGNCPPIPISPHWCLRHISPSTTIPLVPKGTLIAKTLYNRFPKSHTHPTQEVGDVINPNICSPASVQAIGTNYAVMYAQEGSNVHPSMPVNLVQGKEIAHCVFTTIASSSTAEITKDPSEYVEVYDSGASCHMSPYKEAFTNLRPITPESILTGNNQTFEAVGMGNLPVKVPNGDGFTSITLSDVLYTPSITFTLISLRQIDKAGYTTLIEGRELHLIDRSDNTIVGRIPVHNDLWRVQSTKALENGTSLLPGNHMATMISPVQHPPIRVNPVLQVPPLPTWGIKSCFGITCYCGQSLQRCLILEQFHCAFDHVHGYVHCISHGVLIPSSSLLSHLSIQHISDFNGLAGPANRVVEKVQMHLQESYRLELDQAIPDLGWKLKHQIPSNRDIAFSRLKKCPHCQALFSTLKKIKSHGLKTHPGTTGWETLKWEELLVVKKAQKPFEGWEEYWYEVLDQLQPTEGEVVAMSLSDISSPLNPLNPPPPPQFCQDLGYISWIQSIGTPPLYKLLAIPGTPPTRNTPGKDGLLEKCLLRVHTFLEEYLGSGEHWLYTHHRELLHILRTGYDYHFSNDSYFLTNLFPSSSRNPYGKILSSPIRYRPSLSRVISFFLRLHHLQETGRCPPQLVINITATQDEARRALYLAAFQRPELSDSNFAQVVHTLCDSLLRAQTSSLVKIFGPIEFAFCFYMKLPDGKYRTANNLTQFFAGVQWCLRIILGHILRLQESKLASYIPCHHVEDPSPPCNSTSSIMPPLCLNSPEGSQGSIHATQIGLLEDIPSSTQWEDQEDDAEAGSESDDPLDELDDSEDYPVDEGPGDFIVRENTGLYLLPKIQGHSGVYALDSNSEGLEVNHLIPQESGGLLW